jgi:hypothetical protein
MDLSEEERRSLDNRMLEEAARLQADYGHSPGTAMLFARYSRDMLQQSLEKPLPLCTVTGL